MPDISAPNAVPPDAAARPWLLPALLLGVVAGAALQLQQPVLWRPQAYWMLLGAAGVAAWAAGWLAAGRIVPAKAFQRASPVLALAAGALALYALCGLRAADYLDHTLASALEGQDIRVTGVVAAMPQSNEAGTRLRLEVEAAQLRGTPVQLPALIDVAWYGGVFRSDGAVDLQRQPPALQAGERWELTVRLKAPHGLRNPHGFDYELCSVQSVV